MLRRCVLVGAVVVLTALTTGGRALADPVDPVPDGANPLGFDCLGYRWKTDPKPGSAEWTDRDRENQFCSSQRYVDRSFQPVGNTTPTYGQDPYRIPTLPGNGRATRRLTSDSKSPSAPVVNSHWK